MGIKEAIPATGIILAGGESSRMSAPKGLLEVGGLSIIGRELLALRPLFDEVVIVANDPAAYASFGCVVVPDDARYKGVRGPMTGLLSGLAAAGCDYCFVVACDMPFIEPGLVRYMAGLAQGYDVVVPMAGVNVEPLFGFYRKASLTVFGGALQRGVRRLQGVFGDLRVRYVVEAEMRPFDPELRSFINVNTPYDLARAEATIRR